MAIVLAVLVLPVPGAVGFAGPPPAPAQSQPTPEVKPAQIVILVDESGSIADADLVREKEAAALIAQAEFSPRSSVAIVGFGSDEGGVAPVDVVCPPIVVAGAVEKQRLSECVTKLAKRVPGKGDDTDHAAALEQALTYFSDTSDGPRIVFLLTDGQLDVGDTARYGSGKTSEQRNDAARELLGDLLARAAGDQVQVWPLGFGAVDQAALDRLAMGGFQGACGPTAPGPEAIVVASSADIARAIFQAFSASRCGGGGLRTDIVPSGDTINVPVDIPSIATDGSIIVVKHDPRIGVAYRDPNGNPVPKSGTAGGSTFEASGENGAVEALRIVDPLPGTWMVQIASPPEVPVQEVSTAVSWQGAVQARLIPGQSSLSAGQPLSVSLALRTRRGPVTDPAQLAGLSFTAELTSAGDAPIPIPLADNGQAPDPASGDGTFTGQVIVPTTAKDSVTIVGHVQGIGISGDDPRATVSIVAGGPAILAVANLPNINDTVAPGDSTEGRVTITNNSGQLRKVRLLVSQDADSTITVSQSDAVKEIGASGNTAFPVTLEFAPETPVGSARGTLRIVDDADTDTEYGIFPFTIQVKEPPPYLRYALIVAVLLTAVVVASVVLRRRADARLDGYVVSVSNKLGNKGGEIKQVVPDDCWSYRFEVNHEPGSSAPPQMQVDANGSYRLTRSGAKLCLTAADAKHTLALDQEVLLQNDLTMVVTNPAESPSPYTDRNDDPYVPPRSPAYNDPDA